MTKRILFVILAACAIGLLAMAGVAVADGGPHGGYTPTTDGCAGCHRAHTADAPSLLTVPATDLCLSCHGAAGAGADTDVVNGIYEAGDSGGTLGTVGAGLRGGGFTNTFMNTDFSLSATSAGVTSTHNHDGSLGTLWGSGAVNSGAGTIDFALQCTNCHDPHGNQRYRILRPIPTGSGAAAVDVPDVTGGYTVADATGLYFTEGYAFDAGEVNETADMVDEYVSLSDWCTACHTRYLADPDSGNSPLVDGAVTDSIFTYRHMTENVFLDGFGAPSCDKCHASSLPTFNDQYWSHDVECATCHVAHGTSAVMTGDGPYSSTVEWPGDAPGSGPGDDSRSSLLRLDNRGVCQACHDK